ncbi:unnamed protein product [Calicophoron daubneyi]|uniref:Tensin n=1 Tax=Calicophoron daubneyi TaxID=300641 RepID=A0AAV2TY19_CALDB
MSSSTGQNELSNPVDQKSVPNRFTSENSTEFVSVTSVEPMDESTEDKKSLDLTFEEHEKSLSELIPIRSSLKKKPRFVEKPEIVNLPSTDKDLPKISAMDEDIDECLSEKMDAISFTLAEEKADNSVKTGDQSVKPCARLEQLSVRIFATILPDNETPEQRHCDLLQAYNRLHEITNGCEVLVINCGEPNTQLMTIFKWIQNCPFKLDGYPDLATFVAFCERVYDWLATSSSHVILLNAEAEEAQTRLLLLCCALASFYETSERRDPTTSQLLYRYVSSYPNGTIQTPVAWLRYAGYMRLFSPENCLSILRASIHIYHIVIYNFPVFEENKLRIFFKLYSGSPLRLVYTTGIYDFIGTKTSNLLISFKNVPGSQHPNDGISAQGNITLIAYHCRPYPSRRLRLFRLHFHSCQSITDPIDFCREDFDEICDAFPMNTNLRLHCSNRPIISEATHLSVRVEQVTPGSLANGGLPPPTSNELGKPMKPDDAVRMFDSLEDIPNSYRGSYPNRTVSFRSFSNKNRPHLDLHTDLKRTNKRISTIATMDEMQDLENLDESGLYDYLTNENVYDHGEVDVGSSSENSVKRSSSGFSDRKKIFRSIFSNKNVGKSKEARHLHVDLVEPVQTDAELKETMPPPPGSTVPKSNKKRKNIGHRFLKLLTGHSKDEVDFGEGSGGSADDQTPSSGHSSETNSTTSLPYRLVRSLKAVAGERGTDTVKLGPPQKTRKIVTSVGEGEQVVVSLPLFQHTEDLLEAARRLNFMAGTQELDRLLEELRLTSMSMASGLPPPPNASHSPKPYNYSTQTQRSQLMQNNVHSESRYRNSRSASAGLYGDHGMNNGHPSNYTYQKQSTYHTEKRIDGLGRPNYATGFRPNYSPIPAPRHHATYTTVLKQRPPVAPKQYSQVHLTIDPEFGTTEATSIPNGRDSSSTREQRLEQELNSAKQELAQLRRAMSLVEERHRQESQQDFHSRLSPAQFPPPRSPASMHHQYVSSSSSTYQTQHRGARSVSPSSSRAISAREKSSSTFQRNYSRPDNLYFQHHSERFQDQKSYSVPTPCTDSTKDKPSPLKRKTLRYSRLARPQSPSSGTKDFCTDVDVKTVNEPGQLSPELKTYNSADGPITRSLDGDCSVYSSDMDTKWSLHSNRNPLTPPPRPSDLAHTSTATERAQEVSESSSVCLMNRSPVTVSYLPRSTGPSPTIFRSRLASSSSVSPPAPNSVRPTNPRSPIDHGRYESDLAFRRVTSVSSPPGRSGYSAHRERLKQEREQELLMRQQRHRQMAASTTGLHEEHLQQQTRHQQQYRSMSAVNQPTGGAEAFEEVETIILQPIGRGVQDIDSHVGSMTTLQRGPGGSMMDGLNRPEGSQRGVLARRGFSSTQFLNRNISNTDLTRTNVTHHSQTIHNAGLNSVPVQQNRYGTSSTLVNNPAAGSLAGSRSQLSGAPSTIIAPTSAPPQTVTGWKTDPIKRYFPDGTDPSNFGIVQDTAPVWYRPSLSREAAISILRQQPPGSFLIRDSTTFKDAFGLAVKVATLPPKVTPKSGFTKFIRSILNDLQSELVRHYLIEVVHSPTKGVRLKGFASEPVFPSLAALIHQHTIDPLALPCRLILPPVPTTLPSSGTAVLPPLVIGTSQPGDAQSAIDNVTSSGSVLGITPSETGSVQLDGVSRTSRGGSIPIQIDGQIASSPNVPYVTVIRDSPSATMGVMSDANQGSTFRCLMLGSIDTPQWDTELCFARAVDQLIPLTILTAADCDHGISRVRYTEVQLHVSPHDGVTIIDLQRRLFFRRHLPNHILIYCGLEPRKKEFSHPEHQLHGIVHPKIFGIVVRKGISECTTHVFSECDPLHPAEEIVRHIRTTYPHMNLR